LQPRISRSERLHSFCVFTMSTMRVLVRCIVKLRAWGPCARWQRRHLLPRPQLVVSQPERCLVYRICGGLQAPSVPSFALDWATK